MGVDGRHLRRGRQRALVHARGWRLEGSARKLLIYRLEPPDFLLETGDPILQRPVFRLEDRDVAGSCGGKE